MSIDLDGAFENRAPFKPEAPLANHNEVKGLTIEATDPFDKGSMGPNLAPLLIALEQFTDANPWDGLRFGALNSKSKGVFRGPAWQSHTYDITVGPDETTMVRDGKLRFQANAGVVVRNYVASPGHLSLQVKSDREFRLITYEFESGSLKATIDGRPAGPLTIIKGAAAIAVPRGQYAVEVTR